MVTCSHLHLTKELRHPTDRLCLRLRDLSLKHRLLASQGLMWSSGIRTVTASDKGVSERIFQHGSVGMSEAWIPVSASEAVNVVTWPSAPIRLVHTPITCRQNSLNTGTEVMHCALPTSGIGSTSSGEFVNAEITEFRYSYGNEIDGNTGFSHAHNRLATSQTLPPVTWSSQIQGCCMTLIQVNVIHGLFSDGHWAKKTSVYNVEWTIEPGKPRMKHEVLGTVWRTVIESVVADICRPAHLSS